MYYNSRSETWCSSCGGPCDIMNSKCASCRTQNVIISENNKLLDHNNQIIDEINNLSRQLAILQSNSVNYSINSHEEPVYANKFVERYYKNRELREQQLSVANNAEKNIEPTNNVITSSDDSFITKNYIGISLIIIIGLISLFVSIIH